MKFPVNLVLEIRTQEEYDRAQEMLKSLGEKSKKDMDTVEVGLEDRAVIKMTDSSKESRVLVNGHQIASGTNEEMAKRYDTECAMHIRSNITLQEWQDGDYKPIRLRRLQKI